MKLDTSRIRSMEILEKPDGRYIRIGYVKKTRPMSGTTSRLGEFRQGLWKRPVVKVIVASTAAAILANIIILGIT